MDKTLQTTAWSCLPREFREEVKQMYQDLKANYDKYAKEEAWDTAKAIYNKICILKETFGIHNLTSDAEGEEDEMLVVSRKQVQKAYKECDRYFCFEGMLEDLFGSKCLPDEDSSNLAKLEKNGEPKFKVGDKVCNLYSGSRQAYIVLGIDRQIWGDVYRVKRMNFDKEGLYHEKWLEPYTEPKEHIAENHNLSQHCDKSSDNPQTYKAKADTTHFGDSNEMVNDRRLHIAGGTANATTIN